MLELLQQFFATRKMKQAIKLATEAIYSERFDMELVINQLANIDEPIELLRAYIAIQVATQLSEPLEDADIIHALEELKSSGERLNKPDFESIVRLRKELAEMCWQHKTVEILERKLAAKENEYSYEAAIYQLEKGKGPASIEMRAKYQMLAARIEETEKKLRDHLDEKASNEAFDEAFDKLVAKIESEKRSLN